jgi:hypothetical protein
MNRPEPLGWSDSSLVAEWCIDYRRAAWGPTTKTKTRRFTRRGDAARFLNRLRSDGRPDLSEVTDLRIRRRAVGDWCPASLDSEGGTA